MVSYLIIYTEPDKVRPGVFHEDPMINEFTYGNIDANGKKLYENVRENDYLFFHKSIGGKRRITAYYVVKIVMRTEDAQANKFIKKMYTNPHLHRIVRSSYDTIVFGDIKKSRVLDKPLVLEEKLLMSLSKPPNLNIHQTELASITSALRTWKELNYDDIKLLLSEIEKVNYSQVPNTMYLS